MSQVIIFKQGGLDDYENAMYAALIGDIDHVSILRFILCIEFFVFNLY